MPDVVLTHLLKLLDISDPELADALGVTRQTVYNRKSGRQQMKLRHLGETADVLGIPSHVLLLPPVEAIRWLIDNQPSRIAGGPTPDGEIRSNDPILWKFPTAQIHTLPDRSNGLDGLALAS